MLGNAILVVLSFITLPCTSARWRWRFVVDGCSSHASRRCADSLRLADYDVKLASHLAAGQSVALFASIALLVRTPTPERADLLSHAHSLASQYSTFVHAEAALTSFCASLPTNDCGRPESDRPRRLGCAPCVDRCLVRHPKAHCGALFSRGLSQLDPMGDLQTLLNARNVNSASDADLRLRLLMKA